MQVVCPVADVWDSPHQGERVTQALQFERVGQVEKRGEWCRVRCLDQPQHGEEGWQGYEGWVEAKAIGPRRPRKRRPPPLPDRDALVRWIETWLDVPYLWGGLTREGIDCSGLIHLAYRMQGWQIPRDSCDQKRRALPRALEDLRPGDLLFSEGHVMLVSNANQILEAAESAGCVRRYCLKQRLDETALSGGQLLP